LRTSERYPGRQAASLAVLDHGLRADVDAGEVQHAARAHSHPEVLHGGIDLRRCGAFQHQEFGLAHVNLGHAVTDKAVTDTRDDRHLADRAGHVHGRGEHLRPGLRAAHHLQQLHHIRRAEEVHADHISWPAGRLREEVDVQRGGVGGDNGTRLAQRAEPRADLLLQVHVLEHRLDDEVATGECLVL
jgi:hypothetical protein